MLKKILFIALAIVLPLLFGNAAARAQTDARKVEVGGHLSVITLKDVGEKTIGFGGRFGYNINEYVALDTELNYFPQDPSGNFGETEGLFGIKAGKRFDKFGLFAKARPGFVNFSGAVAARTPELRTKPALDLGGVLEFYPTPRTVVRLDVGDTLIFYGNTVINNAGVRPSARAGTANNSQVGIGFGFRF